MLVGHAPYRAVVELFRDLFDWPISLGTVHNIVRSAVEPARAISCRVDLAGVRIGAHDEIFQAGKPVLVGVDTASTYCYLLRNREKINSAKSPCRFLRFRQNCVDMQDAATIERIRIKYLALVPVMDEPTPTPPGRRRKRWPWVGVACPPFRWQPV